MKICMKRLLAFGFTFILSALTMQPSLASQASGYVSTKRDSCDYFLVKTKMGYDLLEHSSGHEANEGDLLEGTFESFGSHSIYDESAGESLTVYVEDYHLDEDDAMDKLNEKCE
jgi:hypothetical protein